MGSGEATREVGEATMEFGEATRALGEATTEFGEATRELGEAMGGPRHAANMLDGIKEDVQRWRDEATERRSERLDRTEVFYV